MIYSDCSDGTKVSQSTIDRKLSESYREKYYDSNVIVCECCGKENSTASDHTIAKARCKVIHKTELIWHPGNYVRSCDKCHKQWESFKSGEWLNHINCFERIKFLKEHDPEGYTIRVELTELSLQQLITDGHNA